MGVHYIIHDLHPTLQSDHLDGKDLFIYTNRQAYSANFWRTYKLPTYSSSCLKFKSNGLKIMQYWWHIVYFHKQWTAQPDLHVTKVCGTYLKNYNPSVDNVVKVDGTFVGVGTSCVASGVILVPVDAQTHCFPSTTTISQWLWAQA